MYGDWETGAFHTQRLRTKDPLYGGMFGYTGLQYCNSGDWPWQCGIKEGYHRRPGYNGYALMRRTAQAWLTGGSVYPAEITETDSHNMIVKVTGIVMDYKPRLQVVAVNFDSKAHQLGVRLPVAAEDAVRSVLLDEGCASWMDRKELSFRPDNGWLELASTVEPGGVEQYILYVPDKHAYAGLRVPATPEPTAPGDGISLAAQDVGLAWAAVSNAASYAVQISDQPHFREGSVLFEQSELQVNSLQAANSFAGKLRDENVYFWRVRAIGENGGSSAWSTARRFAVNWDRYQQFYAAYQDHHKRFFLKGGQADDILAEGRRMLHKYELQGLDNALQKDGVSYSAAPLSYSKYTVAASWAVDGNWLSKWSTGLYVPAEKAFVGGADFPVRWAASFEEPTTLGHLKIYWGDAKGVDVDMKALLDGRWQTVAACRGNTASVTILQPAAPLETESFRLDVLAGDKPRSVDIREIRLFPDQWEADKDLYADARVTTGIPEEDAERNGAATQVSESTSVGQVPADQIELLAVENGRMKCSFDEAGAFRVADGYRGELRSSRLISAPVKEGNASLEVRFDIMKDAPVGGIQVQVRFPPVNLENATIRWWQKSLTSKLHDTLSILDGEGNRCELWQVTRPADADWVEYVFESGAPNQARSWQHVLPSSERMQGDITQATMVQITVNGTTSTETIQTILDGLVIETGDY